jgi:RNA polymerase sigma factor (sigma-70 family)
MLSRFERIKDKIQDQDEKELIDGILGNSNIVISKIYHSNAQKVKRMVWSFKNLSLDPDDIFQEGLTIALLNVHEGKFRGESSFSSYLNSICRNLCLKQLSKKRHVELTDNHDLIETADVNLGVIEKVLEFKNKIGEKCREVIDLRFSLGEHINHENPNKCLSFEMIAEQLSITQVSARQRFKRCLDQLRELVDSSPSVRAMLFE